MSKATSEDIDRVERRLERMERTLDCVESQLTCLVEALTKRAVDLGIAFGSMPLAHERRRAMAKKATGPTVEVPCLKPKGSGVGAVMPDITLTDPLPKSIKLQPLDTSGAVVNLVTGDSVTGALTSDSPSLTIAAGADQLNFVGTIPPNTPQNSVANLAATLKGTIAGAPADLSASVKVTINVPPAPVAVDLAIVFGS